MSEQIKQCRNKCPNCNSENIRTTDNQPTDTEIDRFTVCYNCNKCGEFFEEQYEVRYIQTVYELLGNNGEPVIDPAAVEAAREAREDR